MSFGVMAGLRDAMAAARADDDGAGGRAHRRGRQGVLRGRRSRRHRRERRRGERARRPRARSPTCSATCGRSASRSSRVCAATRSPAASGSRARATSIVAADDASVRDAGDQRRSVAVHDHGAAAAFDAAEDGARPDDDRPAASTRTRAQRLGFVQRVVPVAELDETVDELAAELAAEVARSS